MKTYSYAESIIAEFPQLHHIAHNRDSVLAYENPFTEKLKKLHYFYEINQREGISFHFNLLSEVNSSYQHWFLRMLKKLNYCKTTVETENDYFDVILLYPESTFKEKLKGMQRYNEYVETMKSYHFSPLQKTGWINTQIQTHGFYKF